MKTLDRYIVRSFLYSYLLCFLVMMGLRIVADLFINFDEFTELDMPAMQRIGYVASYYACNALVYFRELGGVILVAAAAFSLARMNQTNELTAVLASGVSLYRVILPVILVSIGLALVGTANQEVFIPAVKDTLVRDRDDLPGGGVRVNLVTDVERNAWHSPAFRPDTATMVWPLIVGRDERLKLTSKISGRSATFAKPGWWRVTKAMIGVLDRTSHRGGGTSAFIWSPRSPQVLAESGSGRIGSADGLRISFDRADPVDGWLINPRLEVLAPAQASAAIDAERRVLGVLVAPLAWYGPAGGGARDSGYHLVGRPELSAEDVIAPRQLWLRLAGLADRAAADSGRKLWLRLSVGTRQALTTYAGGQLKPKGNLVAAALRSLVLPGLNAVIAGPLLVDINEAASLGLQLAPGDRIALAAGSVDAAAIRRINRTAIDRLMQSRKGEVDAIVPCQGQLLAPSSLTPDDITVRRSRKWLDYLSSSEIGSLLRSGRVTDPESARLIQHIRMAAPVINVIMLMLALPFIVSRERHIKASALLCVAVVGGFHVFVFMSRYLGGEVFATISAGLVDYGFTAASPVWGPILAATLPILIFGPIAMLMLINMENMERPGDNRTLGQILGTLEGRLDRTTFWLRGLLPVLVVVVIALIIDALWIRKPGLLTWAAIIAVAWPTLALLVKRGHDRDRPGSFLLALLVPVLGWLWVLIDLMVLPGGHETNSYGPVPAAASATE